jgi:hypothetical protein
MRRLPIGRRRQSRVLNPLLYGPRHFIKARRLKATDPILAAGALYQ